MKLSAFVLLAAGAAGLIGSAAALADSDVPTERVSFADLNLSTDAGIEQLYGRLHQAALEVCSTPTIREREVESIAIVQACASRALAEAVHKVGSPRLTARHQLRAAAGVVAG